MASIRIHMTSIKVSVGYSGKWDLEKHLILELVSAIPKNSPLFYEYVSFFL
jgi:hypothetical protein